MKKTLFMTLIYSTLLACNNDQNHLNIKLNYPITPKKEVVDIYFDTEVRDHYRWLEDDRLEETELWVKAQNTPAFSYLKKIGYKVEYNNSLSLLII